MRLLHGSKGVVTMAPAFVGMALLVMSMGGGLQQINGSELQQIVGGGDGTCTQGVQLDGNMDCLGMCANNPTYSGTSGANGTTSTNPSCGTCGGQYKGSTACP